MPDNLPLTGDALWQEAAAFAARAHAGQIRKDGLTPYASHPARVAMTVLTVFGFDDATTIAAAFLHDTIEDTPTDYDDIHECFGIEVADIVAALTKNMILPEHEREQEYDRRLADADWRARLVKLADTYDNLSDICTQRLAGPEQFARARHRHLARCTRAIDLAAQDIKAHAETVRAIDILKERMEQESN